MRFTTRTILTSAVMACMSAAAQTAAPEPALPQATYRSAFEDYRSFAAGEVQDWRKSNDVVREIGGWRAYAREIQQGAPGSAAPAQDDKAGATLEPVRPHHGRSQ